MGIQFISLNRVETTEDAMVDDSQKDSEISSVLNPSADDIRSMKRSLKIESRPWIVYDKFPRRRKLDAKQSNMSLSADVSLPKGVIRGCPKCSDCQKVSARWDPEGACSYDLKEAPVFHPSYEEFKDISKYIDSIRQQVEPYGFCRIVPPHSWRFPCFLEEDDIWQSYKFSPKIQRVNEPKIHCSFNKGSANNDLREMKRRKLDSESSDGCAANFSSGGCHEAESFHFESGPEFTPIAFKRQADQFKRCYFSKNSEVLEGQLSPTKHLEQEPSEQDIEGEYWRIVEKPTAHIEVLYGTRNFDRGSQVPSNTELGESLKSTTSDWDLNLISSLPGSLLSFEKLDSSGSLRPQIHIGMCFSSIPWTVEEHFLYKMHYLHMGAPRIWYGVSGCDAHEFEATTKKQISELSADHTLVLQKLGQQLSPGKLKSEGIPVYRCIQRPGDLLLFLPGAYHTGFDCGFNCSTSTAFAPLDWLPHGLTSIEVYRGWKRKTSISYDKLLLRAANEVVKARFENLVRGEKTPIVLTWKQASGKDGIITNALRARVMSEARGREYISPSSQSRKMDKSFDAGGLKRECSLCYYDLYLSAATCSCSPNTYSCLVHAKHFCSCPWTNKFFLFRYQISELNILLEAVEGKITPLRNWIREDLGSALELDRLNQGENGPIEDSPSAAETPAARVASPNIEQASSSKIVASPEKQQASGSKIVASPEKQQSSGSKIVASPQKEQASGSKTVASPENEQASGSKIRTEENEPHFEELFTDHEFRAQAMEFILKNPSDDEGSSSSSDWDIDACIADLESRRMGSVPPASNHNQKPMATKNVVSKTKAALDTASDEQSEKSLSLNHIVLKCTSPIG